MSFKELHQKDNPILICNVWDVASTKVAERLNFQAIGTSSGAMASMLGYQDGEEMSFSELEYLVKRITSNANLPLSVDLESGHSRDANIIVENIKRLVDNGVVGINIEDTVVEGTRKFLPINSFVKTLDEVCNQLAKDKLEVFVNIRTDTFLLKHPTPIKETIHRIQLFEEAGANGIFVPCIEKENDIAKVVQNTSLPINVMCMPELPDFQKLKELGVQRISMGNFLFNAMYQNLENDLNSILKQNSFQKIFS